MPDHANSSGRMSTSVMAARFSVTAKPLKRRSQVCGVRRVTPTPSWSLPLGTPISRSALIARVSCDPNAHSRARKPARSCQRSKCAPDGADLEIGVPRGALARVSSGFHLHRRLAEVSRLPGSRRSDPKRKRDREGAVALFIACRELILNRPVLCPEADMTGRPFLKSHKAGNHESLSGPRPGR
jgi:hypothetical protein